jgi:uncharacterized membrane protein
VDAGWSPSGRRPSVAAVLAIFPISTGYQILGLLHVLAVIAAFGPLFFYPMLQKAGAGPTIARIHLRLTLPALALVWVLGMGLVGMSDDAIEMSETWIVLGLIGWVILMVISWFLIRPALTDSSPAAQGRLGMAIGITHLLLIVQLYLMVFKPGSDLT